MKKKISGLIIISLIMSFLMTGCGRASDYIGELHLYCFGDYFDPELIYNFEDETGIMVVLDNFDTNEEMYPVIANKTTDYDLICCSEYMISKLKQENLIQKIDFNNVPNIKNIDKKNMDMLKAVDEENEYAVPHTWGTYGILYNKSMVKEGEITSWKDLWKEKYKGQIIMTDSLRDTMMVPLKMLGYSENTKNETEISRATDELIKQKPLVYKYANDSTRDLMIGNAAAIAVIPSGDVLYAKECNENLEYIVPDEGSETWTDCWAIIKSAKNKEYAEKFINYMLNPKVAYQNYEYLTYAIPNTGMYDMLNEKEKNSIELFPGKEILDKCEVLQNLDRDTNEIYSKYWKKFKSK